MLVVFVFVVGLVAGAFGIGVWYGNRGFTEDEEALRARIEPSDHQAITRVWLGSEYGSDQRLVVVLGDSATDQDGRDVWCDVIGQTAIDWHRDVGVQSSDRWWPAPSRCADRTDVPAAVAFPA